MENDSKEEYMRMLYTSDEIKLGYRDLVPRIPMSLLNEEMAQTNHGQSLSRLNERGGIGAREAIGIIQKIKIYNITITEKEALDKLIKLINL